jgi:hypothetical protein
MTSVDQSGGVVTECRSCRSSKLVAFLDLGKSPVANRLMPIGSDTSHEEKFPLGLMFCENCSLVQLGYELPADALFDESYPYYSSFSQAMCDHAAEHSQTLMATRNLGANDLVVEVASNDGYLLRNYLSEGVPVLGIDPAPGPARAAEEVGVPTIVDFFGVRLATELVEQGKRASVIVANNVMAHVPDLNDFVGGFAVLLADDGVITVENPYVRELVDHVEFDTVYHEHYCYFSCTAVEQLMNRHGLYLNHVEFFPSLHGGTCRWHISKQPGRSPEAAGYLADEIERGMDKAGFYAEFGSRVRTNLDSLRSLIQGLKSAGHSIAAYGAAAKGCTLLNAAELGLESLDFVVDRNTHKQGHLLPGVHLPIYDTAELLKRRPDFLLILAWNFRDEIIAQQRAYEDGGGKFIVPVPSPTVL